MRVRGGGGVLVWIFPFFEDSGGPSVTMKMDEVNVGGLGVGVTVDIQRTDGEYGKSGK